MSEFKLKTFNGVTWSLIGQFGRQGFTLVIGVILARILSPREFGLLSMIVVIISFAEIFAELGFGAALVQKQNITQIHLSSVFWLNLASGLLLTIIFVLGAPLIAKFYDEPALIPLTMLISVNFVVSSLNIVQNTLLTKQIDFQTLSKVEILSVVMSGGLAIAMAFAGFGVWSLATQSVALSAVTALLLWRLSDWRPSLIFRWDAVKDLLNFSLNMFGNNVLNYWTRNIDYLLIGRFLGSNPLGIYNQAYNIMMIPLIGVSRVLARVMFPTFSLIQEDKERVKRWYLKITRVIALITFPLMMGLFVTVRPFVLTIFGHQWVDMIPVLKILSLVGMVQSIITLNGNLYLSQGRADLQFRLGIVRHAIVIIGIIIGLRWGIVGVAYGYAIATALNAYPGFYFAARLVNLTFVELLQNLYSIFGFSLIMAILVWLLGFTLPSTWPQWAHLSTQVSSGILIYFMFIHFFNDTSYVELRSILVEQILFGLQSFKGVETEL